MPLDFCNGICIYVTNSYNNEYFEKKLCWNNHIQGLNYFSHCAGWKWRVYRSDLKKIKILSYYFNRCQPFGGQCECKPNVIGRSCERCEPGFFGFPDCKECKCPSTATCNEDTGIIIYIFSLFLLYRKLIKDYISIDTGQTLAINKLDTIL